jgi:transposase
MKKQPKPPRSGSAKTPLGKAASRKKTASPAALDPLTHPDAAGIDVGAEEFVAAVPPGRCADPVRSFTSFTSGVEALRDWLLECRITTAAIESTGNYWITLYDTLSASGIDVFLVNARHVKGVPGKKTDVQDAQWLQQLHAAGLLKKSFRPAPDIVPLRFLMRHRREMLDDSARHLQLMQKSLTEMNLKLQHVFSDIDGTSARAIIDAILAGERDPDALARLRDRRCRSSLADIKEALRGDYRPEYLFVLRQSRDAWDRIQQAIAACDEQIGQLAARVSTPIASPTPPPAPGTSLTKKSNKNSPRFPIHDEAWRFYGVDLSLVPGVGTGLLSSLMSELGTRDQILENFHSAAALASWLGLCPDNRISGGRILKAKTRKVKSPLAHAMRLAVFGLQNSDNRMGDYFRRMKARLGKAEGLVATAHKLIRILYGMINRQTPYDEAEAFHLTPQNLARRRRNLEKQAAALGLQLVEAA